MAKVAWALDIGEWSLKIVRGSFDKGTGRITIDLLDVICYGDLSCGYEADTLEKFREGVRVFGEKYTVGRSDALCISISGNEVFSRFINLPPVPERLSEIIRYEARQQIPFDIDRVVWDYQAIKDVFEVGEEIEVGLFALKEERVKEFMEMLLPWERNLKIVQNAPLAVYNFLRFEGLADRPLIVLDVGAHTTDVMVLNHPRFWIRPVLVGGDDMTAALQEGLGVGVAEAERIKDKAGATRHEAQVLRVVTPVVENLVGEVQRSLGYYKSLDRGVRFDRVLLLGNALKLGGLSKLLTDGLQYQVETLKEVKRFDLDPSVDRAGFMKELPGVCSALGLLVQAFGQGHMKINLVPEELTRKEEIKRKRPWVVAAALAILLIAVALVVPELIYAKEFERDADVGKAILSQIERDEGDYSAKETELGEVTGELEDLSVGGMGRDLFLHLVHEVSTTIPGQVYVTDWEFTWVEPGQIPSLKTGLAVGSEKGSRVGAGSAPPGAGVGPTGPGIGPPTGPGMYSPTGQGIGPPMGPGMGSPAGPGPEFGAGPMGPSGASAGRGGLTVMGGAQKSAQSRLVLIFRCESAVIVDGLPYIRKNVIEMLRGMRLPGEAEPAFEEVELGGEPRDVWRNLVTGTVVTGGPVRSRVERMGGGVIEEERVQFVAFSFYAILKPASERMKASATSAGS